jgi:hypothetical protein
MESPFAGAFRRDDWAFSLIEERWKGSGEGVVVGLWRVPEAGSFALAQRPA